MKTARHVPATLALALLGTLVAQPLWACKVPSSPKAIPDGRRAEKEQMLEAKREVDHYVEHVSVYMSCENDARKLQEVKARQKFVTDRFNAEVRAYKAVNRE